ncbi:hypothetical protein, partial [Amycolatopsis rhizosphaerae]|uniref:hypothetical protein n=1 Tax=Amycolatopsis rhizosphaerae TaxID=2053003 RepID=UPI003CCC530E
MPDYWRNYTVIGTEGRAENFGDTGDGVVKVWNRRRDWSFEGDREYPIDGVASGHADADLLTMKSFCGTSRTAKRRRCRRSPPARPWRRARSPRNPCAPAPPRSMFRRCPT